MGFYRGKRICLFLCPSLRGKKGLFLVRSKKKGLHGGKNHSPPHVSSGSPLTVSTHFPLAFGSPSVATGPGLLTVSVGVEINITISSAG